MVASADEPVQDMTVPTGMFQVAMEHERPRMQSQTACQSTGQDVRLQIDLDTLGQDDFDLASSAPAGQRHEGGPGPRPTGSMHVGVDRDNVLVAAEQGQLGMPPRHKRKKSRSKSQLPHSARHPEYRQH